MVAPVDSSVPRVLLVDDRRENLVALRAVLEPLAVEIVEADSGEAALRELLAGDFAVILLDVQMPGMDGLETAAVIKQRERSSAIPIIFLTAAQADLEEIFAGYEAGAVDYLLKPFDPIVLRSKVAVFADLDRARRARARSDQLVDKAFDVSPTGSALCTLDGHIVRANRALAQLAGTTPAALVGELAVGLLRRDDQAALTGSVEMALDGSATASRGAHTQRRDGGTPVPVSVTVVAIRDEDGEPRELLLQLEDQRDRRIAETLQRALLPEKLPVVPGFGLAAHISPGGDGTAVGGDWYDAIALPGGRLGVIVGDVAGRGVEAAARMGELRSVARAYALEGHGPVELVERMNGYHGALSADLMTTLLYAVFEIDTGRLRSVNAGHPPLVLLGADGGARVLRGTGPPLGVMDTWRYHEESVAIAPGEAALIYTDGLVERRGEGIDHGLRRLRESAERLGAGSDRLCERLVSEMADPSGAGDDITLVVVSAEHAIGPRATIKLSPDMEALSASRRVLRRWLDEAGADEAEAAEIVMASNEAWQNALEHGTGFARTTVDVELTLHDREVQIVVRDAGRRERSLTDPDRGRGIELMRALMDDVALEIAPHGSEVRLTRRLRDRDPLPDGAHRTFASPRQRAPA